MICEINYACPHSRLNRKLDGKNKEDLWDLQAQLTEQTSSGGFGQGETRPQAFTGLDGRGYLIGRTQDRIIEIADMSDPDTSTYVSAIIGNPNSMAAHNGSLYVFIGQRPHSF